MSLDDMIQHLVDEIEELKSIMVAVSTGGPPIEQREAQYRQLHSDIAAKLQQLRAAGLQVPDPNMNESLWDWYGYWSSQLPTYQSRRAYIRDVYKPLIDALRDLPIRQADEPAPAPQPASLGAVAAHTSASPRTAAASAVARTVQTQGRAVPAVIADSLARFRSDRPDPSRAAFVMMQFGSGQSHRAIADAIRTGLGSHGIAALRADDREYHDDLFPNVLTYMHGCAFGVAVFERIESDNFNPNVSLEVGYMLALGKPICLLKDKTLTVLHADLVGKLYRAFDPQDPSGTIPAQISAWLRDRSIGGRMAQVPPHDVVAEHVVEPRDGPLEVDWLEW